VEAEILRYAGKYRKYELIQELASALLQMTLTSLATDLPDDVFKRWVLYYEKWSDVLQYARENSVQFESYLRCANHPRFDNFEPVNRILKQMRSVGSLQNLGLLFTKEHLCGCQYPRRNVQEWREKVEKRIMKIPKFFQTSRYVDPCILVD